METGIRRLALPALIIAASLAIHASVAPQSQVAEIQFQIGQEFFVEGRYFEALEAYQKAVEASDPSDARAARSGVIMSALRVAEFDLARTQADALLKAAPRDPEALALHGDTLWVRGPLRRSGAKVPRDARGKYRFGARPSRSRSSSSGLQPA